MLSINQLILLIPLSLHKIAETETPKRSLNKRSMLFVKNKNNFSFQSLITCITTSNEYISLSLSNFFSKLVSYD